MGSCLTRICSSGSSSSSSSKPVAMEDPPPPPPPLKKKLIILSTAVSHCDYDDPPLVPVIQPSKEMIPPIKPSSSPHQPKHRHLSIDHIQVIRDGHIDDQPKLRRCSSLNNLSGASCTLLEAHNKLEDEHVEGGSEVVTVLDKKMVGGGNPCQMGVLKEEQPQPSNGEEIIPNKSSDLHLQTSIVDYKPDLYYLCYSTGSDLSTSSSVGVITPSLSRDNSSLSNTYQSHSRSCSLSRREAISLSVEDIMMLLEREELDEDDLLSFLSISSSKSSLSSSVVRCGTESVSETGSEASSFEFRIRSGSSTPPTPCMFKQRINIHYPPPHLLTLTPDEMAEIWGVFEARHAFSSSSSSTSTSSSSSSVSTPAVIITNACS